MMAEVATKVRVRVHRLGADPCELELPAGATVRDALRAAGADLALAERGDLAVRGRGSLRSLSLDTPVEDQQDLLLTQEVVGGA